MMMINKAHTLQNFLHYYANYIKANDNMRTFFDELSANIEKLSYLGAPDMVIATDSITKVISLEHFVAYMTALGYKVKTTINLVTISWV